MFCEICTVAVTYLRCAYVNTLEMCTVVGTVTTTV